VWSTGLGLPKKGPCKEAFSSAVVAGTKLGWRMIVSLTHSMMGWNLLEMQMNLEADGSSWGDLEHSS